MNSSNPPCALGSFLTSTGCIRKVEQCLKNISTNPLRNSPKISGKNPQKNRLDLNMEFLKEFCKKNPEGIPKQILKNP